MRPWHASARRGLSSPFRPILHGAAPGASRRLPEPIASPHTPDVLLREPTTPSPEHLQGLFLQGAGVHQVEDSLSVAEQRLDAAGMLRPTWPKIPRAPSSSSRSHSLVSASLIGRVSRKRRFGPNHRPKPTVLQGIAVAHTTNLSEPP